MSKAIIKYLQDNEILKTAEEYDALMKAEEAEDEERYCKYYEKIMLSLPSTVASLIENHQIYTILNKKLYAEHPEFKGHTEVVASVVEMVDSENPSMDYAKLLEKAIPKIQERIKIKKSLDMTNVQSNPNRDFKQFRIGDSSPNGEI